MRIGIFGGSFNPPHRMHKKIIKDMISKGYVDKIYIVPTGDLYYKKGLISYEHRVNMLNMLVKDISGVEVSDVGNINDFSFTFQLLDYFQKLNPKDEICFICGADNLEDFKNWNRYQYILENYKLIVMARNNLNLDNYLREVKDAIIKVNNEEDDVSSSKIREKLRLGKVPEELDKDIVDYIKENKLYRE